MYGFMQKDLRTIRWFCLGGCLVWILYGALLDSYSIMIANIFIAIIQITKLIKEE